MATETTVVCKVAQQRQRSAAQYEDNLNLLLWVFALAIVVSLTVLMLFYSRQDWATAAVGLVGTAAGGFGIKWVVDRQTDAIKEEKEAYEEVKNACGGITTTADNLRMQLKLR